MTLRPSPPASEGVRPTPPPDGVRPAATGRIYGYVIALLMLPAVVLSRQDNVLFTPIGWTDPWFYFGYAQNLVEFKRYLFRDLYYGMRLGWILPAHAVYSLFSPVTAACVLHLSVWAAAVLSFFFALRWIAGPRSAFLTAALLGLHPWLWASTGWDYPDGAGIVYVLAATALYTHAALQPGRWFSLLMAGAAAGAALHSNLFWAAAGPLLPLTYIALAYSWHKRSPVRSCLEAALWSGLGAVLLTAALGGVNYSLDGSFGLFGPSMRQGRMLMSQSFVWTSGVWGGHGLSPWLWFALAGVAISVALLPWRLRRGALRRSLPALAFSLQLCLALGFLAYMQRTGTQGLATTWYASSVIPFVFLVVGTSFWKGIGDLNARTYLAVCAGAVAVFGFAWYGGAALLPAGVAAGLILALLISALCARRTLASAILAIAGFGILTFQVRLPAAAGPHQARRNFERITQVRQRLELVRHRRRIHFWFDQGDPELPDFTALNSSYLANWSFLNTGFPKLSCGPFTAPDTGVVVLSTRRDAPELARGALADCWRKDGLLAKLEDSAAVEGVTRPYTVTAIFAQPDPSVRGPLRAVFGAAAGSLAPVGNPPDGAPFPLDRWHAMQGAEARFSPAEVQVRTPRDAYAFALVYPPLVAPVTARYSFTARYTLRSGEFAFGLSAPVACTWMAVSSTGPGFQPPGQIVVYADLKQGDAFQLTIANNGNHGPGAASLAIREVSAVILDPACARARPASPNPL